MRSVSVWMSSTGASWSVRKIVERPADRVRDSGGLAGTDQRQPASAAAVHEEPVEGVSERLHAVVVGHERERGLRFAGGDDALRPQPGHTGAGTHCASGLRVDVERKAVSGLLERPVACGIDRLEAESGGLRAGDIDPHQHRTALHADPLGRNADPRIAAPQDLFVGGRPLRVRIDAAADVQPLDDDRAAETRLVARAPHEDACPVRRSTVRRERPAAVLGERAGCRVRRRRSRCGVLVLDVAGALEVHGDRVAEDRRRCRRKCPRSRRTVRPGAAASVSPAPAEVLEPPTAAISSATVPATASAAGLGNGCELQIERAQPAEDVGR